MAIAIRDTAPIQGKQAEELEELFYGDLRTNGKIRKDLLDATLAPETLEALRHLEMSTR